MEEIIIPISRWSILNSVPGDISECAVSTAIREHGRFESPLSDKNGLTFYNPEDGIHYGRIGTEAYTAWVSTYEDSNGYNTNEAFLILTADERGKGAEIRDESQPGAVSEAFGKRNEQLSRNRDHHQVFTGDRCLCKDCTKTGGRK